MRIELKDIVLLFEQMQEELNISYVSIVVFVGVDADSICTLKIFSVGYLRLRKCSNARTSSTRPTRSPTTERCSITSKKAESTTRSKCSCSSTAEASSTSQSTGSSRKNRPRSSSSTCTSLSTTPMWPLPMYHPSHPDQNRRRWPQKLRILSH
jgi:hypothetical protein